MYVTLTEIEADEGTVVVFNGTVTDSDTEVAVAVDARAAYDIADRLPVEAWVEAWQVVRHG